jgi:hypothetical protein
MREKLVQQGFALGQFRADDVSVEPASEEQGFASLSVPKHLTVDAALASAPGVPHS